MILRVGSSLALPFFGSGRDVRRRKVSLRTRATMAGRAGICIFNMFNHVK